MWFVIGHFLIKWLCKVQGSLNNITKFISITFQIAEHYWIVYWKQEDDSHFFDLSYVDTCYCALISSNALFSKNEDFRKVDDLSWYR